MPDDDENFPDRAEAGASVTAGADDEVMARVHLIGELNKRGKWADAESESRAVLKVLAGDTGRATRFVRMERGHALLRMDRPKTAAGEFATLLRILRKLPEPPADEVAIVRGYLGRALLESGRYRRAEPELRALLDSGLGKYGEDDEGVLEVRRLISRALSGRKRYAEAAVELDPVLESYQRTGRAETSEALSARALRAVMVAKNEEYAAALHELREVHETQKRVLGDDHEDTRQTAEYIEGVTCQRKEPWRDLIAALIGLAILVPIVLWFLTR